MPIDARVFPEARAVLDHLLADLDARAPGMITGAHLTGSIALGDGRPGQSDIDLVLVRAEGIDNAATMAALEPAIDDLRRALATPVIDALVIDETELASGPDGIDADHPIIQQGEPGRGAGGLNNPVTWATLRQCGIAWRGKLDRDQLWHDPARLATRPVLPDLIEEATEWGVLGVTRLHATLATGAIASKRGAGSYALDAFSPEWYPIIDDAIRIRERQPAPSRFPDPRDATREMRAYMAMVIDDALALPVLAPSDL